MTLLARSILSIVIACAAVSSLPAAIITFSGDYTPDASVVEGSNPATNASLYTTVVFSGTSWVADSGYLKMTTAPVRGIWFGNHPTAGGDPGSFPVGSSLSGNKLTVTSLLTPDSQSWGYQLYDGSHAASFYFQATDNGQTLPGVNISTAGGNLRVDGDGFNINVLHTYEIHLQGGIVSYTIDGEVVYEGAAGSGSGSAYYLLGDGSGSTPTGTGSMWIDSMSFDNAAGIVPEPQHFAAVFGFGACLFALLRRRA